MTNGIEAYYMHWLSWHGRFNVKVARSYDGSVSQAIGEEI